MVFVLVVELRGGGVAVEAVEGDLVAGVGDHSSDVACGVDNFDRHLRPHRDLTQASPEFGALGGADSVGKPLRGGLVQLSAREGDHARQRQCVGPAFGFPGRLGCRVAAAAGRSQ